MRVLAFLVLVTALWVPGASAWEQGQFTWSAPWSWMSLVPESKLGLCIASGKDLNGDSIHDMVFAAPFEDHNGEELGRVYVVLGSTSGWVPEQGILSSAVASYWGEAGGITQEGPTREGRLALRSCRASTTMRSPTSSSCPLATTRPGTSTGKSTSCSARRPDGPTG